MKIKTTIKTLAFSALFTLISQPAAAQDLLARQAPVDRKMKKVDTLALRHIIERENYESPAAELYADWNNGHVHLRQNSLPESYRIDLRHFCMPTPSRVVTSNYGPRWGRTHEGLDIKVYTGDTIRAAFSGKVRIVKWDGRGYGKYIVIRHNNGLETVYGHLSKQLVQENQRMERNVQRRNPASQPYLMHSTANSPESRQTEITTTVETEMETVITEDGRTISVRHSTASFVRVRSGSVQCVRSVSVRLRRQRILK